jgi:hypothetical protein
MRQLLEAISTRQRLRSFWQRNLVTLAMLRWNLPDLKTEKGEHYADILTNLYKQQMRLVWEEAKANQRRASKLAIEGGEANAQRQKVQKQGHHIGAIRTQETEQLSSAPETSLEGRNDSRSPKVEHSQTNERQNPSEGRLEQGGHRNGDAAEPSSAIDADRIRTQKAESRNNGGDVVTGRVDKTSLPISTPRRVRDKEHLRYVASQPCIICGRSPGHAHHLRFAQPRALGRKVSDEWTVPLCSTHHRALHGVGDEKQWWKEKRIDPIVHAVRLWWDTRHGGVEHPNRIAGAGSGIVFAGGDGPLKAGKQFDQSVQTAGPMKDGACE